MNFRALGRHLLLSLRLNFRSRQPLVYGYIVPVFFLLAFGSVFRSGTPPLLREMGQLLTITVLGGACFGMPTAMVSERERGVWRRYRLMPTSTSSLIISGMVCRYVLVLSAAILQITLAWCFYRTPLPARPAELIVAFSAVSFAFLGLGLIVAMLADTVPAVQALGQAIFLPMIMIGGVGVPLRNLPEWVQRVAYFFPGNYAVDSLQACIAPDGGGLGNTRFALLALSIIGAVSCVAGVELFRWESGQRTRLDARKAGWLAAAFGTWIVVGGTGNVLRSRHVPTAVSIPVLLAQPTTAPVQPTAAPAQLKTTPTMAAPVQLKTAPIVPPKLVMGWQTITAYDLARIDYDGLPNDEGYVLPLARNLDKLDDEGKTRLNNFQDALAYWKPGKVENTEQRLRNLLSVCAVADLVQDRNESEIAYAVFDEIQNDFAPDQLTKMIGWLILHPDEGTVINNVNDLGIESEATGGQTRDRVISYAKKLLLRLQDKRSPRSVPTRR